MANSAIARETMESETYDLLVATEAVEKAADLLNGGDGSIRDRLLQLHLASRGLIEQRAFVELLGPDALEEANATLSADLLDVIELSQKARAVLAAHGDKVKEICREIIPWRSPDKPELH